MTSLRTFAPFPLALLAALPLFAQADELDTLQFQVGQSVKHDSNVFRLSDGANTQAVLGTNDRSDTIGVTTLGIKLDKSYGLQRFEVEVQADDYNYRRYSALDFTAFNYAAAWRWSLTPAFRGNLTTDRQEYIDTTADVQNAGQLNRRTERTSLFDAEYELGAAWRLVGGVFQRDSSNSLPTFEADYSVRGAEGGLRYVSSAGNSIAYRLKGGEGEYSGRTPGPFTTTDFTDREHEIRAEWTPTGKTAVQARFSHLDRKHDRVAARDFSGFIGRLNAAWAITGKTRLTGGFARELGSYQTNTASYYEGYRVFLAPIYKPTEKTAVRLRYDHGVRDFKGPLPGFAPTNRRDTFRLGSLSVEWQVVRALTLMATLQREKRSSTAAGFDYKSNALTLSAQASF